MLAGGFSFAAKMVEQNLQEATLPMIRPLHERKFAGKPLKSLKLYYDPFGENEMCVELAFTDGEIASVCIGPGRPQIISATVCFEPESSAVQDEEEEDRACSRSDVIDLIAR